MDVSSGWYLRTRYRYWVHRHLSAIRSRGGTSVGWWGGLAQVSHRKDDGLVGYPWPLRPDGLSLRTCRVLAVPCVGTGQPIRNAGSDGIRGAVRCLGLGSYMDELRLATHSQRFTRGRRERRAARGLPRGCELHVPRAGIAHGSVR